MTHALKAWPEFFENVNAGDKFAEIRKNDRDFKVGDKILLQEFNPDTKRYTGRELELIITNVLSNFRGINKDYCMLSFKHIRESISTAVPLPPVENITMDFAEAKDNAAGLVDPWEEPIPSNASEAFPDNLDAIGNANPPEVTNTEKTAKNGKKQTAAKAN